MQYVLIVIVTYPAVFSGFHLSTMRPNYFLEPSQKACQDDRDILLGSYAFVQSAVCEPIQPLKRATAFDPLFDF